MIKSCFLLLGVLVSLQLSAAEPAKRTSATLPALKVAADGFPEGSDSPEGAACDLARAFIKRDTQLFEQTCIKSFGADVKKAEYEKFLAAVKSGMEEEAAKKTPSPAGPKEISKVYAARRLTKNGPASAGYAMFGFHDIRFVDVGVTLHNGKTALNRTMVILAANDKWYVYPTPQLEELLSTGLNDEKPSEIDFSEAYEVQK